jgi:hypothetical protein
VLAKIAAILDTQTESLVRIGGMMQSIHRAVHGADEDGVVP